MKRARRASLACDVRGFTLAELLVTLVIFAIIGLGAGSLYLSTTRAMDEGSTIAYVQRQGTQIEEELLRHTHRATGLEVDNTQSLCKPSGSLSVPAGKSIAYRRQVGTSSSSTAPASDELWCLYEYQRTGDAFPQLWRCQVCGASSTACVLASFTPPHTCSSAPENLVKSALRGFGGLPIGVSGTTFTCGAAGCSASVDVTFALDVKRSTTDPVGVALAQPRQFAFNITIRN
jgi:prepilin-type N-terminal cleavage/methylation domain-containing protein